MAGVSENQSWKLKDKFSHNGETYMIVELKSNRYGALRESSGIVFNCDVFYVDVADFMDTHWTDAIKL